jgi:SAM-dependent methyltransferase
MDAKHPSDLQYNDCAAYVGKFTPKARARILDVGSGSGGLAAALGAAGHVVTAIDTSPEAVQEARSNGIDAQQADLLDFAGGPFDVVLFSFSLHHIAPLGQALKKARALLGPEGRMILDEFAIERVDAATAAWFFATQDLLAAAGLLGDTEPSGVLEGKEPLARWRERFEPGRHGQGGHSHKARGQGGHGREGHGHFSEKLHEGDAMRAGVAAAFQILHEERTPALARFWLHRFRENALPIALQLVPLERLMIALGIIRPFGFRIAATPR